MTTSPTPAERADEAMTSLGIKFGEVYTRTAMRNAITCAVTHDRAARPGRNIVTDLADYIEGLATTSQQEHSPDALRRTAAYVRDADNLDWFAETFIDPIVAELVELHGKPKCDECDKDATEFWPKLAEPVQLCDECTHNARRSGWEPGR